MPTLKALTNFGKRKIGEVFDATAADARVLVILGRAEHHTKEITQDSQITKSDTSELPKLPPKGAKKKEGG